MKETFLSRLRDVAEKNWDNTILSVVRYGEDDRAYTYREVMERASQFAAAFLDRGVTQDHVILIFLKQGVDGVAAFLGAIMAGAVPSFMPSQTDRQNPELFWSSHRKLCRRIKPKVLVTEEASLQLVMESLGQSDLEVMTIKALGGNSSFGVKVERSGADLLLLQHSSGTTGLKKGVMLSNAAVLKQLDLYAETLALHHKDCIVSWLPLYHDMGLVACFLMPFLHGVPLVLLDPFEWVLAPNSLFDAVERHRGTLVWLPNFAFNHLTRYREDREIDLSSVRAYLNCSETCKWESFQLFHKTFRDYGVKESQLQVCYAMAEMVYAVSQTPLGVAPKPLWVDSQALAEHRLKLCSPESDHAQGLLSNGPPLPGVNVKIIDGQGGSLPEREIGEIAVSADFMFSGYFMMEQEVVSEQGWYCTRDMGFLHDGELYVLGRLDDMVIACGKNVYSHSVETEVSALEGVSPGRVVAMGIYDPLSATQQLVIVAESKLKDPKAREALHNEIIERILAIYDLAPHAVKLVESGWIIKTTSGKVSRKSNKEKYLESLALEGVTN